MPQLSPLMWEMYMVMVNTFFLVWIFVYYFFSLKVVELDFVKKSLMCWWW